MPSCASPEAELIAMPALCLCEKWRAGHTDQTRIGLLFYNRQGKLVKGVKPSRL